MNNRRRVVFRGLLIFCGAFLFLSAYQLFQHRPLYATGEDALLYLMFFFDDETTWAPNYSEENFKKIHKMMSQEDIIKLIGTPLKKETYENREVWRYTTAPIDSNYWFRIIVFDKRGRVLSTDRRYFVD